MAEESCRCSPSGSQASREGAFQRETHSCPSLHPWQWKSEKGGMERMTVIGGDLEVEKEKMLNIPVR